MSKNLRQMHISSLLGFGQRLNTGKGGGESQNKFHDCSSLGDVKNINIDTYYFLSEKKGEKIKQWAGRVFSFWDKSTCLKKNLCLPMHPTTVKKAENNSCPPLALSSEMLTKFCCFPVDSAYVFCAVKNLDSGKRLQVTLLSAHSRSENIVLNIIGPASQTTTT